MFNPGDVLLYTAPALKFSNLIPKTIRLITGNEVEHIALVIGEVPDGFMIIEALIGGVKIKVMSEAELCCRKDDFRLHGIATMLPIRSFNSIDILNIANKYDKSGYGYLTIFNLLIQHTKTRISPSRTWSDSFKSKDGYICSQLIQLIYEELGFKFNKLASLTEPDDWTTNPWIYVKI